MEFKKILIAVDRATKSKSPVFEQGVALAAKEGAKTLILHALPAETTAELEDRVGAMSEVKILSSNDVLKNRTDKEIIQIRSWLEGLCQSSSECGLDSNYTVEIGKPGAAIVKVAKQWGADLIVLGSTHRGSLADAILDSTANHVIHHAPCSVLFVH